MRLIDRIHQYLEFKGITAYKFEHDCTIANGYLKKQAKGKGSVGSDILEKIHKKYADLNLVWLLTGKGLMTVPLGGKALEEDEGPYLTFKDEMIALLRRQVAVLEASIADKDRIIALLDSGGKGKKSAKPEGHSPRPSKNPADPKGGKGKG